MNILGIFLVTLYLFLPWVGRSGTNVWVLVNSPCGSTENSPFAIRFLPGGEVVSGVTDGEGRWSYVGPEADFVEFFDNNVWMGKPVVNDGVDFHSYFPQCPSVVECAEVEGCAPSEKTRSCSLRRCLRLGGLAKE